MATSIDNEAPEKRFSDVFQLYQLLSINQRISLPSSIKNDLHHFIEEIKNEPPIDLKAFGLKNTSIDMVLTNLRIIYELEAYPLPSLGMILTKRRGDDLYKLTKEALALGVDVNDDSLNRHRPLQLLIKAILDSRKKLELVSEFIKLEADIHTVDNSGLTPYQVAVVEGNKSIADLLHQKGANRKVPPGTGYAQHYNMDRTIPI